MNIIEWTAFDPTNITAHGIVPRPGRKRQKHSVELFDIVTAFDIETSSLHFPLEKGQRTNDHAFMYIWQWSFGNEVVVVGRTWEEFEALCSKIHTAFVEYRDQHQMQEIPHIAVYVHNLAYEWQFLSGIYDFQQDDCFFTHPRKPLRCRMYGVLELRCSYRLSNMTLAKYAQTLGAQTQKLDGQKFDYEKIRFPWTPLTDYQMEYCINDVISLVECIQIELRRGADSLHTIPMTSTGYVRRECRDALKPQRRWLIEPMLPTERQYKLLRRAFRGGNTHANAVGGMVARVLDGVISYDMSSCYPAQQLTKKYPMHQFKFLREPVKMEQAAYFIRAGYAVVADYEFHGLELRNHREPMPYLSYAKTRATGVTLDNGRILSADFCATALTQVDLKIVMRQYKFDTIAIRECMVAQKDFLPDAYRNVIRGYYAYKTTMKRQAESDPDIAYLYMKTKNKLNGIYGMSAQDPVHQLVTYQNGEFCRSGYDSAETAENLMKAAFPYQWGVYTTAYARAALQQAIDLAGGKMVYCDTDSVKTLGAVDYSEINARRQALAEEHGAYADDSKGARHYMGVFEPDGVYDKFITQGAKRYAYESDGKMHVIVAGVTHLKNPETGLQYCVEELGDLKYFKPPQTWTKAGGVTAVYNDDDDFWYVDQQSGRSVHITKNVAIVSCTYKMSYADDYMALLHNVITYGDWRKFTE